MRATQPYIQQKFDEFNVLCFNGKLPPIPIVVSKARTYLGVCAYRTKRDFLGRKRNYDFRLRISAYFDLPEAVLEDTLIHEMIHYYIAYHHLKDTSTHGNLFRQMMADLNTRYDRHITVSHHLTSEQIREAAEKRRKPHAVAVVGFDDGRVAFKVLPMQHERIATYCSRVRRAPRVTSVDVFFTDNHFFNRYPISSALKVYYIEESELKEVLKDACVWRG